MSENKEECPVVKVEYEEAKKLADLGAIVQDLKSTLETCSRLKKLLKEDPQDGLLIENMWTAALIRYARCFATGKRYGLTTSILDGLQGEPHVVHKKYIDLRDKHIAHSVNPFEQMGVGLVLSPQNSRERKIIGVVTLSMKLICEDIEGVHQLGMLVKVLLDKVCEVAKQYEKMTQEKGSTIPIDDLYNYEILKMTAPGHESTDKPRP